MKKLLLTLTILTIASTQAADVNEQLFNAVEASSVAQAKAALNAGAYIDTIKDNYTPLTAAVFNFNLEMVEFLIEQGANCCISGEYNDVCALVFAAEFEWHDMLKLMLEKSDSIDLEKLDRALFITVNTHSEHECDLCLEKIVTLLLEHGASPYYYFNDTFITERTAYELAKSAGLTNITKLFTRCAEHGGIRCSYCTSCTDDCDDC